jgi:hypothetical protein
MRFRAKILLGGKTATGFEVPAKVIADLGSSKRPAVRVTLKKYTYRTTVAPMGGKFMIGVSAEVRERAGVKAGDQVEVDLALDADPRPVEVPADFAKVLKREPGPKRLFEGLSYSTKQILVRPIANGKTPETRQRNIDKAMEMLRKGRV